MLWEEHTNYFTPESLKCGFSAIGFQLEKYIVYPYPQEDALVAVFQQQNPGHTAPMSIPTGELFIGNIFREQIEQLRSTIADILEELKNKYGEIVFFGAGHRTVMFINLLNIAHLISIVIDDDEMKQKLKLPVSGLKIQPSDAIEKKNVGVCLLSLNIEIEEKIKCIVNTKAGREIQLFSISPDSKNALPVLNAF